MWGEDVQESSGYDGKLDEGLRPADNVRVEFGLLLSIHQTLLYVLYALGFGTKALRVYPLADKRLSPLTES